MELHAVQASLMVGHGGLRRVVRMGQTHEAGRQCRHGIAVAHPHRRAVIDVGEQIDRIVDKQRRLAVLGPTGGHDRTAQLLHHQLHAVTNPQHRDAQLPDRRIAERRALLVDRIGTTAEEDAARSQGAELLSGGGVAHHQREDLGLAHTAGNQLRVLRAEIENDNGGMAARSGGVVLRV